MTHITMHMVLWNLRLTKSLAIVTIREMALELVVNKMIIRKNFILSRAMVAILLATICMYDDFDDRFECRVDFRVGNVDSNCKEFEKESDSDKEGLMKASDNHSKVIKYPN